MNRIHPKRLLARYQIEPKKSLGQNFLTDQRFLARIAETAEISPTDQVLEIGAGTGALTHHLAAKAERLVVVELDDRLIPLLQEALTPYDNVTLIHGDILEQEMAGLFSRPYIVVANLPYYITGAILRHLLSASRKPLRMVLTVQKEVAERITAVPPQMSLLAVSVQFYGRAEIVTPIKAGAFWPRPEVDSAVVRIDLASWTRAEGEKAAPPVDENFFFRVVKAGFSQKRKQLQKNLRQLNVSREKIVMALEEAGIDGRRRAETLTVAEWIALCHAIL